MDTRRILLGVIGRPHGVHGQVRVVSHTEDPAALAAYGTLTDERGRRWTLAWRGEGIAELHERNRAWPSPTGTKPRPLPPQVVRRPRPAAADAGGRVLPC